MDTPQLLLFGSPALRLAGESIAFVAERRFQLLAYLAFSEDWVERDRLAGLFWPDHDNESARRNVRKVVYRARASPWLHNLEMRGDALRWPISTDVALFRQALNEGRHLEAYVLYRGPLLCGLDDPSNVSFTNWLNARRASLHLQWRDALLTALPQLAAPERSAAARRLHEDDPFDERAVMACLSALRADGKLVEARAVYRAYARRLAEDLGVEPAARLRESARSVLDELQPVGTAGGNPNAAALVAAPPVARDVFVGRRIELQELLSLIRRPECRVITIFGAGGIGKSRLAREALPQLEAVFASAVRWIALEDLTEDAAALARIAAALGVVVNDAADLVAQIAAQCAQQRTLLVFDNAEHLPSFSAVLQRLLTVWPALRLVVTSRARVGVADEWLLPLGGLAVPDADSRDLEAATAFDAVRLFDLRARTVRPEFELAAHLASVIEIAERVDGMPLAIEMAAAWVRLLPPSEIARELSHSVEILQRPSQPSIPERLGHESVRAVFHHSWKLLAPSERDALAKVSVFKGGFRREAATAVTGATLPVLASLADKSLLAVDEQGRFGLHPLVAAYAAEQLAGDTAAMVGARHAQHFAGWLESVSKDARWNAVVGASEFDTESANCRCAWDFAVREQRADLALAMHPAMIRFLDSRGRWREACVLFDAALASDALTRKSPALRLHLMLSLSTLHYRLGDPRQSEAFARAALPLARQLADRVSMIGSLNNLGLTLLNRGEPAQALRFFSEAVKRAREAGYRQRLGKSLINAAIAENTLGRFERCLALNEEALAVERELAQDDGVAIALNNIGNLHRMLGDPARARSVLEVNLQFCAERGLVARSQYCRLSLGHALIELRQFDKARQLLQLTLAESHATGQLQVELLAMLRLARLDLIECNLASCLSQCRTVFDGARSRGFKGISLEALVIHADLHMNHGDRAHARRLWRWLADNEVLNRFERDYARARLEVLRDTDPVEPAEVTAFDLEVAAAWLRAEHPEFEPVAA